MSNLEIVHLRSSRNSDLSQGRHQKASIEAGEGFWCRGGKGEGASFVKDGASFVKVKEKGLMLAVERTEKRGL